LNSSRVPPPPRMERNAHSGSWAHVAARASQKCPNDDEKDRASVQQLLIFMTDRIAKLERCVEQLEHKRVARSEGDNDKQAAGKTTNRTTIVK
jgi:hypothetical protein